MLSKSNKKNIIWINISAPTVDDIKLFQEEFLINDYVAKDILTPTIRPNVSAFENYTYIVQHFPRLSTKRDNKRRYEVDFILGKNWIATVTYDDLKKILNIESIIDNIMRDDSHGFYDVGYIYAKIVNEFYSKCNNKLDAIDNNLDSIEKDIYADQEKLMLKRLSFEMRKVIDFEHSLNMHEIILNKVTAFGTNIYNKRFADLMEKNMDTLNEMLSRLTFVKSAITEFQTTNDAILQHKTSDAMKTLTMMSFVIFPLSLIAGLFGMNATHIPLIGEEYDFYKIIGVMIIVTSLLFFYFRTKKWL